MSAWVYVFGEVSGVDVKVGHTLEATTQRRLDEVNAEKNHETYVQLAAVRTTLDFERLTHRCFGPPIKHKGKEYFPITDQLVAWIVWLRQQWWTSFSSDDSADDWPLTHFSEAIPDEYRRRDLPPNDPQVIVQTWWQLQGPLAGTYWNFLPDPKASFQDYFTPPEIVARAQQAMGGIDLDAASHWIAHRRFHTAGLGIEIPRYFTVNDSAFDKDWNSRVWLNPPYKNNAPWIEKITTELDEGRLEQLCWLSPVHVFNTSMVLDLVGRASCAVILSPTPKFFNPGDPSKDGTNLPHAIFYWGERTAEFLAAFESVGIPFTLARSEVVA